MALQMDFYHDKLKLNLADCYWKVIYFSGDKENVDHNMGCFKDESASADPSNVLHVDSHKFTANFDDKAENLLKQCYLNAKQKEKYKLSKDLLEKNNGNGKETGG